MRFRVESLGCKANRYDARRLAALLAGAGWEEAEGDGHVDSTILFGCVVTSTAEAKSRQALKRAAANSTRTIAAGCTGRMWANGDAACETTSERDVTHLASLLGLSCMEAGGAFLADGRTRAVIKVQEGCPAACSYCIVPHVRPGSTSRLPADVLAEARAAAESGVPEIVITGVHTGIYGHDLAEDGGRRSNHANLASLLCMLLESLKEQPIRIRLSSVEPLEVTDSLIEAIAESEGRITPFIHLPLQSGDNAVLERMNRPYHIEDYMAVVERIRCALPSVGIGVDVMAGFPGETDAAFEKTLAAIGAVRPVRVHVFTYSERPGTPAAEFYGQVPASERRARARTADDAARSATRAFAESLAGRAVEVIPEGKDLNKGYTGEYAVFTTENSFTGGGIRKAVVTAASEPGPFPAATVIVEETI